MVIIIGTFGGVVATFIAVRNLINTASSGLSCLFSTDIILNNSSQIIYLSNSTEVQNNIFNLTEFFTDVTN